MPWCEECAKYLTPNAMNDDGTCPKCGGQVDEPVVADGAEDDKAPWHFKLLVVAVAVYLGWRIVDLVN